MADVIRIYGITWCGDCKRAKKFFGERRIAYDWTDIDGDEEGQRIVVEANNGKRIIPTIFFDDGIVLAEPSNVELDRQLNLKPLRTTPCSYLDARQKIGRCRRSMPPGAD